MAVAVVAAAVRNGSKFSQCNVMWGGFAQARGLGVEGLILVDALFLLHGRRRREGKKKEKEKRKKLPWERRVSPGLDLPCWLCRRSLLLGAIKG
jgi:hypothetical protein